MANSRMISILFEERARKSVVSIGKAQHEFDLYHITSGITTSPWVNRTAKCTKSSGVQDMVVAKLLWLHLCGSVSRKVLILKERDMAEGVSRRFGGSGFFSPTSEVWLCAPTANAITYHSDLQHFDDGGDIPERGVL